MQMSINVLTQDFGPDNMPLSVEDMVSHHNFSSNNRIKRSLSIQDDSYTAKEVIKQFIDTYKGKYMYIFIVICFSYINNLKCLNVFVVICV